MKNLILRTCNSDMTSYGGFVWPTSGPVECPDWKPTPKCGNGLHGFLWGEGDWSLADWDSDAKWLVVEVEEYVDLNEKVKFPRGNVVFCGCRLDATRYLYEHGGRGYAIIGAHIVVEDNQHALVGDRGTATAGYGGTATAGDWGTATAGSHGTATAGSHGTATAGYQGTATAGDRGTATAGYGGIIVIHYYDKRLRKKTGYIGETLDTTGTPLKPNAAYKLNDKNEFQEISHA